MWKEVWVEPKGRKYEQVHRAMREGNEARGAHVTSIRDRRTMQEFVRSKQKISGPNHVPFYIVPFVFIIYFHTADKSHISGTKGFVIFPFRRS